MFIVNICFKFHLSLSINATHLNCDNVSPTCSFVSFLLFVLQTTEESLRKAFEVYGTVENTQIIKDPVTKISR